jgi:hypothetical protein
MINNLEHFTFNCAIHSKLKRRRGKLNVLSYNHIYISLRQKVVHHRSVNIFNSLPTFLVDSVEDENYFIGKLEELLIYNSFCSVDEFFNYCQDL